MKNIVLITSTTLALVLSSAVNANTNTRNTDAASYSFSIGADSKFAITQSQHIPATQSREYSLDVNGQSLQRGVSLTTSAPGALVRISAADGRSAVEPQMMNISQKGGKSFAKGSGFDMLVDSNSMQAQGIGFQRGTTGFKLADELGKGEFTLQTNQKINPNGKYLINVFEKNSDTALYLKSKSGSYFKGETLKVDAQVFDQGQAQTIRNIKGQLVSPTGQSYPVIFKKSGDGYQVKMPMKMAVDNVPGALWELHTEVKAHVNGKLVQRNGRVPFSYDQMTASAGSNVQVVGGDKNLKAMVPVSVKKDSRFEVRGVLYGTDKVGNMKPIMVTHTADNLSRGAGQITMEFDSSILAKSGLSAPYELRNVELRDQSQMAILK
ncbi:DUF4785 domain-containing protein [Kangiella koreensis]|uniref:DUF4785 domain-containing protein n=1 Tax=Kangiella koreensis (strain DSM 16069 / JCM 12317 / KCTC 12182 / SW-125) TaxID=523791 RepID=C7R5P8_KANKD|nr:DUF4785 domain-containing protein [Kangiella koreensis]ACV27222.1 conserved hypothetical protein [Kangiella koreensis DSM 16069]